jgi:tetratricopeptide (TPR) repeat protein
MSQLLEILGRGMTVDAADLIWHWFNSVQLFETESEAVQYQQLSKIIASMADMQIDAAEEQLQLYLFENPSCTRGRLAAAAICLQKNQLQSAVEHLTSVYMRQPSNTMALYGLGHCYERLGKEAEAAEFYQDCLKFKNHLQLPRQRLAAIYFKNGQLEKTIREYELLKNEYPDDILTLVILGYLYIAVADYARAVETFNIAILIHPDNFHSDDDIDQLIRDEQLQEALEKIESWREKQPERLDLIIKHGDVLSMLGDNAEAASQYEEALRICPDFLETTIKLGTQYLQMQQEQLAARQFNRAVEINDRIVDAYIGLATAYKLSGNSSESLSILSLASAIQPNTSVLFAETAALQFKTQIDEKNWTSHNVDELPNPMEAIIAAHRQQIDLRPQNPDLYYRLGILMMSVGRLSEAVKSFQKVLEINSTHTRAKNKLVVCLFETDQQKAAIEQLSGPKCIETNTLELHYKTALLYYDKIKFASSLINLEQQMANNFAYADTAVNVSIVLQNLGLLDRASIMWENLSDTAYQAISTDYPPFSSDEF